MLDWTNISININGKNLSHLRFADDIVVIIKQSAQLQKMWTNIGMQTICLQINAAKTKIVNNLTSVNLGSGSETLEYTNEYVYLGL